MNVDSTKTFEAGSLIFQEGEPGNCAYIIKEGKVELSILSNGQHLPVAVLEKGELFGEMALIDDSVRSATAIAEEDAELLIISRNYIEQKIDSSDPTVRLLLQVVMERYRDIHSRLVNVVDGLIEQEKSVKKSFLRTLLYPYFMLTGGIKSAVSKQRHAATQKRNFIYKDAVSTSESITKENNLKLALENEEFEMYYQPIVDISTGNIAGCEALIRWNSSVYGFVPPDKFISLAEKTGLIIPLGNWITQQACKAACEFRKQKDMYMSINLSTRQFESSSFLFDIEEAVKAAGIPNECIKFEITESILMSNPELAELSLNKLKDAGFSIAIDDFGTGYSSFSYLHRFPIDTLKIDRSFVIEMFNNKRSMEIVRTLTLLSKNLNMKTIAEGIENSAEGEQLDSFGCNYGQGYLYSKPVPYSEFIELLGNETLPATATA
jgi:EAL domain-containing protein (putative c-di-GMP-specific phosphodiesterase class I)